MIYVAQNDTYLSPTSDLMTGKGVNDDASLSFEAGKSYRIRIINMASLASKLYHGNAKLTI
jgi:iron transport multicopper oxidase